MSFPPAASPDGQGQPAPQYPAPQIGQYPPQAGQYPPPQPGQYPQQPAQYPQRQQPPTKKPIYTRWWFWLIIGIIFLGGIGAILGGGDNKTVVTPQSATMAPSITPTTTPSASAMYPEVAVPDVVGMNGEAARKALKDMDFLVVSFEDETGEKSVWDKENWTVTAQEPAAGTMLSTLEIVTLKVHHDVPDTTPVESTPQEATTEGLTGSTALTSCANTWETLLKNEYPASKVKIHYILGVLAEEYDAENDEWFIKITASVDSNDLNVECYMTGSEASPTFIDGNVY